ncbi:AT-rich interactive domain-containing protein 1A-like [Prinia subflava]|uniref:AT-rich interactive domain-containing protein 1A-like n=1 Tax=Prinia subflava TaxID=208062 RepID=UPI002FDFEDD4
MARVGTVPGQVLWDIRLFSVPSCVCSVSPFRGGGEGAGRELGGAPRCGPAAFAAHCVAVAAATAAAAGGLGGGPGRARGAAAAEGRVCQHRAHGPGPACPQPGLPAARPAQPGTLPAGSHPHTRARGHAQGLFPSSLLAPGVPLDGSRCQPGPWGCSVPLPRQRLMRAVPGSLFLSQIYGRRFAADADLSSSVPVEFLGRWRQQHRGKLCQKGEESGIQQNHICHHLCSNRTTSVTPGGLIWTASNTLTERVSA